MIYEDCNDMYFVVVERINVVEIKWAFWIIMYKLSRLLIFDSFFDTGLMLSLKKKTMSIVPDLTQLYFAYNMSVTFR